MLIRRSGLLFFEEQIKIFDKGFEIKKAYTDYKRYGDEEGYNSFNSRTLALR
jgi:hypothetical protein